MEDVTIETTEMHTGGEPVRIIERGYPPIEGATLLDKRRFLIDHLDHLRTGLMLEPRGHDDMYGALLVDPDHPDADLAVLFLHNEGYSTMCGHATIALGRYAVERGLVTSVQPTTHFVLQCPCGPVDVWVDVDTDGGAGEVRFHSVDAFAAALDVDVDVPGWGMVRCDLAYGGAFYAVVGAASLGLDVRQSRVADLRQAATALTAALAGHPAIGGTGDPDLHFLYGSILTDDAPATAEQPSANVCVFADAQVDRSPTGSGVTARIALGVARGHIQHGDLRHYRSVLDTAMHGRVVAVMPDDPFPRVTVEVGGRAWFTGSATFTWEPQDPLFEGFRLR